MERIDILLATYNGSKYLPEQLNSILSQSYKNINVIIRDDGSSDNTVDIIKEYEQEDNRVRLLNDNLGNLGFVRNFEELMKHSDAEYIMFSDQDDVWYKNKVEISYLEIKKIEGEYGCKVPTLVHTNSRILNFEVKTTKKFISNYAKNYSFENSFFNFFVQGSTMIINKYLKEESLPFSEYVYLHDRYLHLVAEFIGIRRYIDIPTMDYRQHLNNEIGSKSESIFKRLYSGRYYNNSDKLLFINIYETYEKRLKKNKIKKLKIFFKIIDTNISRFLRLYWCLKEDVPMSLRKKIFLLLKG